MPPAPSRHILYRLNWQCIAKGGFVRLAGALREAVFDSAEAAEAERARREAVAREVVNPFASGLDPFEQTSMPEPVLCDWLLDHGIEPPAAHAATGHRPWASWWSVAAPRWDDRQSAAAWEALDKMRFYEVACEPVRPVVYAVAEVDHHYCEAWYVNLQAAYRTRARADAECARMNVGRFSGAEEGDGGRPANPGDPFRNARPGDSRDFEDRPIGGFPPHLCYHVVEIEVDNLLANAVHVLARVTWVGAERGRFQSPMESGLAFAFVRGFANETEALAVCREEIAQAHALLPPGRCLGYPSMWTENFAASVHRLGLAPPDDPDIDLAEGGALLSWWDSVAATATVDQRVGVWALLEGTELFRVISTKVAD